MDLLPKQMCHRCSYKLEEFHKFYIDCLKTDAALKSQLSWMRKDRDKEKVGVPMVHIENMKIKTEPLDYDVYELEPLVENIEYINSMAFPAGNIHNGHTLTYTAFPRCQCCCDKKDQSKSQRSAAQLRRDYEESKQGRMTDDLRKKSFVSQESSAARIRGPIKRKAEFLDCPRSHQSRIDENVQDRLAVTTDTKNNISSLETRNRSRSRFNETVSENQTASTSTTVRNLRPRKNLNFLSSKKKSVSDKSRLSVTVKPNTLKPKMTITSDFEPMRQIKTEPINEYEKRNLRPRRNVVDYKESRSDRVKRRKVDDAESKLQLKNENASNAMNVTIKKEIPDSEGTVSSSETFKVATSSRNKYRDITPLTPRIKLSNNLRNAVIDYLKLVEQKTLSNIVNNNLTKTKKKNNRFPAANCTPKSLRSQNTHLRNGKVRGNNYAEWSEKKLQTKRLMDVVNNDVKKIRESAMLKLAESIKHYCEKCNVTFLNKEVFNLHACYY